jgi:serine/threonine protein phosphatase PrpC
MKAQFWIATETAAPVFLVAGALDVVVFTRPKNSPNEDAAAVAVDDEGRTLLVLADGAGGEAAGARAAEIAVHSLMEQPNATRESVLQGLDLAQERVLGLGIGAATTLFVLSCEDGVVRSYHAGDSTTLVVGQRGKIKLGVVPHSPTGYAVEAGMISEREAIHHEERHLVTNIIGAESVHIDMSSPHTLARRDTILLASDGLSDNLLPREVIEIVRKGALKKAAAALAAKAIARMDEPREGQPSKPDDLTLVLARRRTPRGNARKG